MEYYTRLSWKNLPAKYNKLIKDYISKAHASEDLIVQK